MLKLSRRVTLAGLGALLAFGPVAAADWPQKPVTVIVPQAAGNSPDVLCRIIADKLSRALGQQFVVENRPGAANVVGMQSAARAANDGYTFVFATSAALVTNPYTIKNLSYDPIKDFVPVAMVAKSHHLLLVNPDVKANNLAELIALEKAEPGSLSIAVDGPRNISGLIAQAINKDAGTKLVLVPYNTISNAVQDSISGRTPVTIQSASVVEPFIKDGSLRAIAVAGSERISTLPDVPAIAETLKSVGLQGWFMVMAPAGTPSDILETMSKTIATALAEPDVKERAPTLGFELAKGEPVSPSGAKAFLESQLAYTGTVIKSLGIEPN
ncbi:tripartite tricarboxylate transporter substrate binding protein [Agrobacterium sp. a22-2]|uniref:Bug family tripartite tricarboxylate transporter substrate binding protein n=1 Tax=Agrobacterium sp. a22-2 TaxID=2283840 RepID=UPI001444AE3A|nr:tripartite tricarboxylate transporter substrate binding protein [Agrobacterium sp. a22-2]NKN37335.1 tripartite tricarboxylate transporter substrate binding protein [Agrobacterium sp. a22-2]